MGDNIAQIDVLEETSITFNEEEITIIPNTTDKVVGVEWTIVNFYKKYLTLFNYRLEENKDASLSPLYVLKIYNSGTLLQNVRYDYRNEYPLNKEGDEAFIRDFEEFKEIGKEMFRSYLTKSGSEYALNVRNRITSELTYEEYCREGQLFSDPKYVKKIQEIMATYNYENKTKKEPEDYSFIE